MGIVRFLLEGSIFKNKLATGVYNLELIVGEERTTTQFIKQ